MKGHNYGQCRLCNQEHIHPKGMKNKNHKENTRRKIGEAQKGRKHSEESIEKTRLGLTGKKRTEETKQKLKLVNLGRKHTEQTKVKMSLKRKGEKNAMYGRKHSIETIKKISKRCGNKLEKHPNWKGGTSFELYGFDFSKENKTKIRKRDNFTCNLCSKHGFVIHHIDYNKKNNEPTNLITLCRSCHVKTNYNRPYWMDLFRGALKCVQ